MYPDQSAASITVGRPGIAPKRAGHRADQVVPRSWHNGLPAPNTSCQRAPVYRFRAATPEDGKRAPAACLMSDEAEADASAEDDDDDAEGASRTAVHEELAAAQSTGHRRRSMRLHGRIVLVESQPGRNLCAQASAAPIAGRQREPPSVDRPFRESACPFGSATGPQHGRRKTCGRPPSGPVTPRLPGAAAIPRQSARRDCAGPDARIVGHTRRRLRDDRAAEQRSRSHADCDNNSLGKLHA